MDFYWHWVYPVSALVAIVMEGIHWNWDWDELLPHALVALVPFLNTAHAVLMVAIYYLEWRLEQDRRKHNHK